MTDELDLLRAADPVRADAGPWRDRPLDARAERRLNDLLHGELPHGKPGKQHGELLHGKPGKQHGEPSEQHSQPGKQRPKRRRRLILSAAVGTVAAATALVLVFSPAGGTSAIAAPAPLHPYSASAAVPLDVVARRAQAIADAEGGRYGGHRGSHLQTWSLSMETGPDAAAPVTVPEERISRWNPDGSGSEMVVATDPLHPGRPVINDDHGPWRTVNDGKVLRRQDYPPGTSGHHGLVGEIPPSDPEELRRFLRDLYGNTTRTPQLLRALSSFLQDWTPGPGQTAAVVKMLLGADGLRPAGAVTDRLGRKGQAYVYDGPDDAGDATRSMIILDPDDGRVLGLETTFTKDVPDFKIKAGQVLSYEAWMT
ncbi:CU044_5270 family protein [Streptomyces sp. NPDC003077]|uniref:CU044_5270 family protein n=1 Tax=Streptomyces sp. NPDC003077 TaxID=3154443 RepID=UPI0033B473AA